MILNFKTRNEARKYCWKWNIPLKNIKKHNDGSNHPWRVTTEETMFKVGRDYKLVDVEGFTEGGKNRANKVQAEQINAHLNGVISLVSKDGDKFRFKSPANVAMDVVRPWEARFFKEVAPVVNAKPKKAKQAPAIKPAVTPAPVEDLDAVLDGGVNLAPVEEKTFSEAWPGIFVTNIPYVLVDEHGFISGHNSNANQIIVDHMKQNNNVVIFDFVDHEGDANIKAEARLPYVLKRERKFFRELGTGKVPETPAVQAVDIESQKRDQEIIAAAQKVEDALAEHQKAIEIVQKAARAVREAAQELALLTRK
ncbi:hypothetical protein BI032_gp094 [Citrobacter phage vB_CfrM_CfP1]|uniref:Uncharacterized protein n=1 Tax=Citrobacter phage vB_CfrM_CfP1 TaxID=1871313 RepID=A0A1B1IXC0_9CAUD|nr:hypothetical protein BI032_gp094 [Citrobacter phage vB_CfrM_CfP1]ANS05972.1 hypothetical protein ABCD_0255 [Citrobacter phage vB_CfrM_CfP1]